MFTVQRKLHLIYRLQNTNQHYIRQMIRRPDGLSHLICISSLVYMFEWFPWLQNMIQWYTFCWRHTDGKSKIDAVQLVQVKIWLSLQNFQNTWQVPKCVHSVLSDHDGTHSDKFWTQVWMQLAINVFFLFSNIWMWHWYNRFWC